MRHITHHILLLLALATLVLSCGKTPRGVMSEGEMADLIVDLQLADAYIESHIGDFTTDSSKMVIKQSIFKKHGITQQDYDSSLVWYAHNIDSYNKAYDKAIGKLKKRYDKLDKRGDGNSNAIAQEMMTGGTTHAEPKKDAIVGHKLGKRPTMTANGDTIDLWKGKRSYTLAQGAKRGFITFDFTPDAKGAPGDRYQLAYFLERCNNEFKVCLSLDYTDGGTTQITRSTNSDGWVAIDLQSDTARQVRRIYGYVSYDIKRGHTAYVDSLSLIRSHLNKSNYGFIHAQRQFDRNKK